MPVQHGERYAERIADARLVTIPGVAHAPFLEDAATTANPLPLADIEDEEDESQDPSSDSGSDAGPANGPEPTPDTTTS